MHQECTLLLFFFLLCVVSLFHVFTASMVDMHSSFGDCYLLAGVSEHLNSLLTRRYDLAQDVNSRINAHHISGEASKEVELSKSSAVVMVNHGIEVTEQNTEGTDREIQVPSGELELIEAESCKMALSIDVQEPREPSFDLHPVERPHETISGTELDACATSTSGIEEKQNQSCTNPHQNSLNGVVDASHDLSDVNNKIVRVVDDMAFGNFTSADCAGGGVVINSLVAAVNDDRSLQVDDLSSAKAASVTVEDMGVDIVNADHLSCSHDDPANVDLDDGVGASASTLDSVIVEAGKDFQADPSTVTGCADASVQDMGLVDGRSVSGNFQTMGSEAGKVTEESVTIVEEQPVSMVPDGENPQVVSFPGPPCTGSECVPSAVGENSCMNIENVESTPVDFAATSEPSVSDTHKSSYSYMTIRIPFKYSFKDMILGSTLLELILLSVNIHIVFFCIGCMVQYSLYFISYRMLDIMSLAVSSST